MIFKELTYFKVNISKGFDMLKKRSSHLYIYTKERLMSARRRRKQGKEKRGNTRRFLEGFSIERKAQIDGVKNAIQGFLVRELKRDQQRERLVAVLNAELRNKKGCQRYLWDIYVDADRDINLLIGQLNNPRNIKPNEKFVVTLFFETFAAMNLPRRV